MSSSEGRLFIGGDWIPAQGDQWITAYDPHTEKESGRVPAAVRADVDAAVAAARVAFDAGPWPRMTVTERAAIIREAAADLRAATDDVARVITSEMGSPISQSLGVQVPRAYQIWEYFSALAQDYPWRQRRPAYDEVNASLELLIEREPVGVVAAIVPWNGPQIVAAMKLAPALVAGCTAVLKPSEEACLSFDFLAEAFRKAGLPDGVLNIVPADRQVSEYLVSHPGVDKVSLTGSTAAGKRVAAVCAESVKRCTLELGGKGAAILLEDVVLDDAMPALTPPMAFINGQACNAPSRLLVPASRAEEATEAIVATLRSLPFGDPNDPNTFIGPLASRRQRDRVASYLELGKAEGATAATGGGLPADQPTGWYVEPTIFTGVDNSMRIAREEIFGPVYCVIPYTDVDDAVRIANDSTYGLEGSVWTADPDRGVEIARRLLSGTVGVNSHNMDMAGPFGGYRQSGIGRECGPEGIEDYTELKCIMPPIGAGRS
ncbi:MAG: aldehyde dehydrogenase [Pseudonocardia sp. SCN 72-86]|nr:MAG: aldehyde dehydrogenase [Pseudonocardia sp. SCN 72-86]